MEAYSKARTADAMTALGRLRPSEALLLTPEEPTVPLYPDYDVDLEKGEPTIKPGMSLRKVEASLLEVGDVVRVLQGSTPPADGTIVAVSGDGAAFDESSLTGESRFIKKAVGDDVFLGTINRGNVVDVRVVVAGKETMLDLVVNIVREGQTKRAPIERVADLVTSYFVPVVSLLAVLTWLIWLCESATVLRASF